MYRFVKETELKSKAADRRQYVLCRFMAGIENGTRIGGRGRELERVGKILTSGARLSCFDAQPHCRSEETSEMRPSSHAAFSESSRP
jgi:hypothetical protein